MNRTRKCAALLIALCMMLTMLPAGASAATDSGQDDSAQFDYRFVTENTIEITAYKGSLERLIIPETLDGYTVVGIADMSLKQRNDNPVAYIEVERYGTIIPSADWKPSFFRRGSKPSETEPFITAPL